MRWAPFLLLAALLTVLQTTFAHALGLSVGRIGAVTPDLLAVLAVVVALYGRGLVDAMLAGWALGLAADLASGGATATGARVGPMAVGFALAAAAVFSVREAFFRERALPRAILAAGFVLISHGIWASLQGILSDGVSWGLYGRWWLQSLQRALYTGVLAPVLAPTLVRLQRLYLAAPPTGRSRRRR